MAKMKADDLRSLTAKRRDAAFGHVSGELKRARIEASQFYRGENLSLYGDSGDGLSTVVSRDTMEAIESLMPPLLKPFVSGDEVVRFDPVGPEDEEPAKQATDWCNYLFTNHNDAFRVVYDSMKDGLLFRYGCAKVVMEEVEEATVESYEGVDLATIQAIEADKELEIVGDEVEQTGDDAFNVRVQRKVKRRMFRVIVLPPEQFLYESRLGSLDDATFLAHHAEKPVGDLIAMGLDKKKCRELKSGSPINSTDDNQRFLWEDDSDDQLDDDDPARKVWVDECYIRCDYDGNGTLVWRKVVIGGNDNTLLLDEEVDDHPFQGWTPIPEPHKLVGMSIADIVRDIQMQKTAVKRENLNALYLSNRPRIGVVDGQVNIDDLLSPSVGGFVRMKAAGAIEALPSGGEGVMSQSLAMIEALDTEREARTGVTRYNQGMDANSLNKTATGVSIITNASQQRQELIARQYAESFLKGVFRKLLKLTIRYPEKQAVIRLRGEWVEIDPSEWKTSYDMSIAVGLGTGNKDQQIAHLNALTQVQSQIAQAQDGLQGPLLTWENVYETVKMYPEAMGFKGVEKFFTDPGKGKEEGGQPEQQSEQQPDPNAMAQQQAQAATEQHAAELAQKHDTAIETAKIDAQTKVEVARISAVKDLVVAGMPLEQAQQVLDAVPDVMAAMEQHVAPQEPDMGTEGMMPPPEEMQAPVEPDMPPEGMPL